MESNYILIAKDYRSIDKQYTHCEIEPSLILSAVTLNIPFPDIHKHLVMCFHLSKLNKQSGFIPVPTIPDLIHLLIFYIILKNNWSLQNIKNIQMLINYPTVVIVLLL